MIMLENEFIYICISLFAIVLGWLSPLIFSLISYPFNTHKKLTAYISETYDSCGVALIALTAASLLMVCFT